MIWDWLRTDSGAVARWARRVGTSALGTYAAYVAHGLLHPHLLRAGASSERAHARLPGDELVVDAEWQTTFEEIVDASPDAVWPWLVQIGWGRAGWYTWYPLDNGGWPSAERVEPSLQQLAVGDVIPDGPRAADGFGVWRVAALDPPHSLVLFSRRTPFSGREVPPDDHGADAFIETSWAFVLQPVVESGTRVTVRVRARLERTRHPAVFAAATRLVFGVGDTVMERSLLQGLKRRAEASAAGRAAAS